MWQYALYIYLRVKRIIWKSEYCVNFAAAYPLELVNIEWERGPLSLLCMFALCFNINMELSKLPGRVGGVVSYRALPSH